MAQITYADKVTGDTFAATEATLIKTVVNANDTAQSAAISLRQLLTEKGAANGYAPLNASSRLPLANSTQIAAPTLDVTAIVAADTIQEIANKAESRIANNTAQIAILNSTSARRRGTNANKSIIAFNSKLPFYSGLSDGTVTTETSRYLYKSIGAVSDIEVHFGNFEPNNSVIGALAYDDVTIEASIEYPAGTMTRLTFNAGNNSFLLKKGFSVKTDLFKGYIPANTVFWVRTNVLVTSGQKWIKNSATLGGFGSLGTEGVTTGSNLVAPGSAAVTTVSSYTFAPIAIVGVSSSKNGSILLRGDSISAGTGDSGQPQVSFGQQGGLFNRALGTNFPTLNGNIPGQIFTFWLKGANSTTNYIDELLSTCQFSLSNLGINDNAVGALAGMQITFLQNCYLDFAKGMKAYQCTLTPRTSSTDAWATLANQTVGTAEANRVSWNTWLRDGCPLDWTTQVASASGASGGNIIRIGDARHPVAGIFDTGLLSESSLNSGKWRVDLGAPTTDGLHPSAVIYAVMVPAIDTTKFSV